MPPSETTRTGIVYALLACGLWGILPIYWKWLGHVPAGEILAQRIVWSLLFIAGILLVQRKRLLSDLSRRVVAAYLLASLFLACNWGLYIWAVNSNRVVETALGYFINPLTSVALGAVVLGERPRRKQWLAVGIAATGVLYLTFAHGELPWVSLVLAISFSLYSLIKKKTPLGAVHGLFVESAALAVPALVYLILLEASSEARFLHHSRSTDLLLVGSGISTALPLLLFSAAVRRLPLTVLGLVQYIAPSIQFLLGVFAFGEPLSPDRLVGFLFIWGGLAVFVLESRTQRASPDKKS